MLAIAYYNLGCQNEFLGHHLKCLENYELAQNLSKKFDMDNHEQMNLAREFTECVQQMREKVLQKE